jgi:hypothetical protein
VAALPRPLKTGRGCIAGPTVIGPKGPAESTSDQTPIPKFSDEVRGDQLTGRPSRTVTPQYSHLRVGESGKRALSLLARLSWIMTIIYANRETYWWTGVLPDMLSVESSP